MWSKILICRNKLVSELVSFIRIATAKFVNQMLYVRNTISLVDVKYVLNSMEVPTILNSKGNDNQNNGLFINSLSKNFFSLKVNPIGGIIRSQISSSF